MTKEKRIVFDASDILRVRLICPRCEAESDHPVDGGRLNVGAYCVHCGDYPLAPDDITVVKNAYYALRAASRLVKREKAIPANGEKQPVSLQLRFEIDQRES